MRINSTSVLRTISEMLVLFSKTTATNTDAFFAMPKN